MPKSLKGVLAAAMGSGLLIAAVALPADASGSGGGGGGGKKKPAFTLTIQHNNDGESSLLPTTIVDEDTGQVFGDVGGAARFYRKVRVERRRAFNDYDWGESWRRGTLLLNSGDNFLAGPTFEAGRQPGAPFYDAEFVKRLRYDALGIGNHEFDFGPAVFAEFIEAVQRGKRTTRFVSANLDYTNEPALAGFVGDELVRSTIVRERGVRIGIVGLTTASLRSISSPGGVDVLQDLAPLAQAEIDRLTRKGVRIIILQSHLQGLDSEIELVSELRDVDVVIGGGGDEILADESTVLVPGTNPAAIYGEYPQIAIDRKGREVPVVTTPGNYRYLGALQVTFDKYGRIIDIDEDYSGIKMVADFSSEAVGESRRIKRLIEEPVAEFIADLEATQVATGEEILDCERVEIRRIESNCGNLIADAHLATGIETAASLGLSTPQIGLQNGGGIRGNIDRGPDLSLADTFGLQPFGNFVVVAENVPGETLRQIIEEGLIASPDGQDGGFTHVSDGTTLVVDTTQQARIANQDTGEELTPGERVRTLILADGTVVVENGVTRPNVFVTLTQLNFSARGGDAQPDLTAIPGVTVTQSPTSDQQSLQSYLEDDLGGAITAAQYPRGGEGRIVIDPPTP